MCSFQDNMTIRPDGVHELDPCIYKAEEVYANVTVVISRCKHCGKTLIEWYKQEDTYRVDGEL